MLPVAARSPVGPQVIMIVM